MIGFSFGSLLSGPFSETFEFNVVYIVTLVLYLLFIMAAALAPTVASHLVFRFLAGLRAMFVSTVLVYLIVPVVYSWTRKKYKQTGRIVPETRLWYAMSGGAPAVPVGLIWMGWTSYVRTLTCLVSLYSTLLPTMTLDSPNTDNLVLC